MVPKSIVSGNNILKFHSHLGKNEKCRGRSYYEKQTRNADQWDFRNFLFDPKENEDTIEIAFYLHMYCLLAFLTSFAPSSF